MVANFTPIDVEKFKKNSNKLNTILLLIATLTTVVLAVMLFILIQKRNQLPPGSFPQIIPTVRPSPEIILTPTINPSPTIASPSSEILPIEQSTSSAEPVKEATNSF